jgi:regulator of RNase E activity RraA
MNDALIARYRAVGSAAVFSALNRLGAPMRLLSLDIRPIHPEQVVVGPAFTLKAVRDPRVHHTPGTEIAKLDDYAMFRAMTPGCVIRAPTTHQAPRSPSSTTTRCSAR